VFLVYPEQESVSLENPANLSPVEFSVLLLTGPILVRRQVGGNTFFHSAGRIVKQPWT
jgi:hypothetical protein